MKKKINASIAIQTLPKTENDKNTLEIIDTIISYIKSQNLKTVVGPFETTIEGNYEELMEILKQCQILAINSGAQWVISHVKIYYNPKGEFLSIENKISKYN